MENVYLVGWAPNRAPASAPLAATADGEDSLQELADLAASAGARVLGRALQRSAHPEAATLVGRGKLEQIRAAARLAQAQAVIFDNDLTPTQLRNVERILELKVLDRTQLILDIFARRARSREGQLQVELAQLTYLLPRLAGQGTMLSRLGGGIGTRGPGEQELEFDRRRIRARIRKLQEDIEHIRSGRALHRAHRAERGFLTVSLVGYTNAGKSTLFNALTRSDILTSGRMFSTLDPTLRRLELDSRRPVLLSDTVGFIRRLPSHLATAFRATLEELEEADLIVHVIDVSHPLQGAHEEAVEKILASLGVAARPRLRVWNKIDRLEAADPRRHSRDPSSAAVSALTGEGLDELRARIDERLGDPVIEADFEFPCTAGEAVARLHRVATVLSERFDDERVCVRARISSSIREQFHTYLRSSA